jgi:CRP-like cAMP-binding protein
VGAGAKNGPGPAVTFPWPDDVPMGEVVEFPAHTVLFRQGQPVRALYLIDDGVVALSKRRAERDVLVAFRSAGWLVGAASALLGEGHGTTAETLRSCRLRALPVGVVGEHGSGRSDLAAWLHGMLAREVADHLDRLARSVASSTEARMEAVLSDLLRLAGEARPDGGRRLALSVTVQQLADIVLCTREQASRVLARLIVRGLLARDAGHWFVAPAGSPLLGRHVAGRE